MDVRRIDNQVFVSCDEAAARAFEPEDLHPELRTVGASDDVSFDLSGVEVASSSFVAMLISLASAGRKVRLRRTTTSLRSQLAVMRVLMLFRVDVGDSGRHTP